MAGDWIKMRVDLANDPAVIAMAVALGVEEDLVVGKLHRLWAWADVHTRDGTTPLVDFKWVNRYVGTSAFAEAMHDVGWLTCDDGVLAFPGFERHNGASAKRRLSAAERQRRSRSRHARVTLPRPFVRAIMSRDNFQCVYCGRQSDAKREGTKKSLLSIDHLVPASRGGLNNTENLVTCCQQCNNEKNDRTPDEWDLLPAFLQSGVSYDKERHEVVTNKCDTSVTREEKRREEEEEGAKRAPSGAFDDFVDDWNAMATRLKLPIVRSKSRSRRAKFTTRCREPGWLDLVPEALEAIEASSFCRGTNGRDWTADIDWLLKPDSVARLVEGKYADANGGAKAKPIEYRK